jgi:hypothetical protein
MSFFRLSLHLRLMSDRQINIGRFFGDNVFSAF